MRFVNTMQTIFFFWLGLVSCFTQRVAHNFQSNAKSRFALWFACCFLISLIFQLFRPVCLIFHSFSEIKYAVLDSDESTNTQPNRVHFSATQCHVFWSSNQCMTIFGHTYGLIENLVSNMFAFSKFNVTNK